MRFFLSMLCVLSCKPYARQGSGLQTAEEADLPTLKLTVKLVQVVPDKPKSILLACIEGSCHNFLLAKDGDEPYYFQTPASVYDTMQTGHRRKKQLRRSMLLGALVVGVAATAYTLTKSKKILQKIDNMARARDDILSYSQAQIEELDTNILSRKVNEYIEESNDTLDFVVNLGGGYSVNVKEAIAESISNENLMQAVTNLEEFDELLQPEKKLLRLATIAALLGTSGTVTAGFVHDLVSDKWWDRQNERVILLFSRGEELTLSPDDFEKFVNVLTKYLPARKIPDFFKLIRVMDKLYQKIRQKMRSHPGSFN